MEKTTEKQIVENFSQEMLKKIELRHNRYAPMGWKSMDIKRLIWLLEGELRELKEALEERNVQGLNALKAHLSGQHMVRATQDEALDIANYAMFIYEKAND